MSTPLVLAEQYWLEDPAHRKFGKCRFTTKHVHVRTALFSNYRFYNAGVGMDKEKPDEGRKDFTKKDGDLRKFRVVWRRGQDGTVLPRRERGDP